MVLEKTDQLRVVLRVLHAGNVLPTHKADGPITVLVLTGRIMFTAESRTVGLREGELLALPASVPHSVRASEESAILIRAAVKGRKA
jgi:quercetin dioxygenase-like cupin family protein